jgi:hypothetical protein
MKKSSARKTRYAENFNHNKFGRSVLGTAGGSRCSAARGLVAEKFLAFLAKETAGYGDVVIALAENVTARD